MDQNYKKCIELDSWLKLVNHARYLQSKTIKDLVDCSSRKSFLQKQADTITIDFHRQLVDEVTLELLIALAEECELAGKIKALVSGERVNSTEGKPALHTALRNPCHSTADYVEPHILAEVNPTLERICDISEKIRSENWLGYSGKPIKDVINIGIGGSDLGPRLCFNAFQPLINQHLNYHFVSDADPMALKNIIHSLSPDTTLFIVSSKSFTTEETLYHARMARNWIGAAHTEQHFIAVTANVNAAHSWGITHVLPIWDWVGGRFSASSAINLITAIAIGYEQFSLFLAGAHSMDQHFQQTPFIENLPVLLGLIGIWNNNFLNIHNLLLLTYGQQLNYLVPYIQQLDMESNGKSIDKQGRPIDYATGPIVWGGPGNQAQHSYYQLLCQGTHRITADFITMQHFNDQLINDLSYRKQKILTEGVHGEGHTCIAGNHPINHIMLSSCTPYNLGALISLYEHKIYTQSVVWNINAFDQPGVQSAKKPLG